MSDALHPEKMLVIGGHSRSVGKTSLAVDLIQTFPQVAWTAIKVTQYGHGICSVNGENCGCAPREHATAIDEERDPSGKTDTSRFLAAGAQRALWLRTKQGMLAEGLPLLRAALAGFGSHDGDYAIVESNSLLRFLRPKVYLMILDPETEDFKESAREALGRADAFVLRGRLEKSNWRLFASQPFGVRPNYSQPLGQALPETLRNFVANRLFSTHPTT